MSFRAYTPFRRLSDAAARRPRRQFMPREKIAELLARAEELLPVLDAPELDWALAERVHDPEYLRRWRAGEVAHAEELKMGFAWSPEVVTRALLSCGGTVAATRDALAVGWGANLAGGTHHAYRDRAEGFSFLNDVVIALTAALDAGQAERPFVLDLDVHQGNGTAKMLEGEPRAFTLSVHGERNYPFEKERSSLDVGLPDGTSDAAYLAALDAQVFPALERERPDLLFYLAGADVLAGDQLGRFALTLEGAAERDRRVFAWAARAGVTVVSVMAGGYNADPDRVVEARLGTLRAGLAAFGGRQEKSALSER